MGRFETQWLAAPENLSAIADLSGQWIDLVQKCWRGHDSRAVARLVESKTLDQNFQL
jgi:hypothetical protein